MMLRSLCIGLASFAITAQANAGSHLWRFSEFYSSPDTRIQFIEMEEIGGSNLETGIEFHWFETSVFNHNHSQLLGTPLPVGTAYKKFLVGSQSYASLPGVPAPDYILPDGVLHPSGDTIHWWFYQTLVIPPNTMPADGTNSLHLISAANPGLGFSTGPNSPTNFAGQTGTVVLPFEAVVPASSRLGLVASIALLLLATWAVGGLRVTRAGFHST